MTTLISNMGFPIFVALYFMVFMRKSLDTNTQVLNEVKIILEQQSKEVPK